MNEEEEDGALCDVCHFSEATETVASSTEKPHDGTMRMCSACHQAYYIGVQHGRHHEAFRHGSKPGRGCSQEKPRRLSRG